MPKEKRTHANKSSTPASVDAMRHSFSHVLAQAVLQMYPEAKLGIGPVIEDGFYYDFDLGAGKTFTPMDLPKLEKRMQKIIAQSLQFERYEASTDESIAYLKTRAQPYKVELAEELKSQGEKTLSFYRTVDPTGKKHFFNDLCKGPHVQTTRELGAFKLMSIAGAYWRGSEKNPMLQRIYGVAFPTQAELDAHLERRRLAEERDHRKIGQKQQLFVIDDRVGKGLPLWLPNGTIIRDEIERLAKETESRYGYLRVSTPHLAKEDLYLTSGHLPYYKDSMYPPMVMDDGTYYMKAMNCPHHHVIYQSSPRSYRELPLRLAEYGVCYRNELSGTLAGLLRVRMLSMNDAHIYCRRDQIKTEFAQVLEIIQYYFKLFGFREYSFRLSKWDPAHTDKYINQPDNWEYSQGVLREILQEMRLPFVEADNEAAFYGPKIDVQFKSVIGREETLSTIQLDFLARERFGLTYVDQQGSRSNEVFVIHRSPLSVHERMVAFLAEHYGGAWPLWLSPVQVQIIMVSEKFSAYAEKLAHELRTAGIRVHLDNADATVSYKIRHAEQAKVPYMVVIGEKEVGAQSLAVRVRGKKEIEQFSLGDFVGRIQKLIAERSVEL
ncbi:MAG: threonine--tRNA ligase [Patescibacteria group bacterium]|nr:threonine--tRNA ligase [Patescibacteria group bacterium]